MVCNMREPCKCSSLDSCQKRFMWTHKKVDLAPHPVVGLELQVGDMENFPQALGFESLVFFFFFFFEREREGERESSSRVHVLQSWRRMEETKDVQSWNLLVKLMVL